MKAHKKKTISKILKIKDSKKKELELEVKIAADRVDETESEIKALQNDYEDKVRYFNESNEKGSIDINNINSYYDFFSRINGRIDEQKEVHTERQVELKTLKESLINAHRDKRVFEILNEKAMKADQKEKSLSEQKEIDFIAISRRIK
jgi:flagellar export protein FliJ